MSDMRKPTNKLIETSKINSLNYLNHWIKPVVPRFVNSQQETKNTKLLDVSGAL